MTRNIGNTLRQQDGPVLVTGHTGFKGTWLTLLLEKLDIPVIGYSLPPKENSLYKTLNREGKINEQFGDISDYSSLSSLIKKARPSAVIHLAAQPLVLESYKQPLMTFQTNVMGTANLLQSAFEADSVKVIASITTDKVYQNKNHSRKFIETDPLEGKDPYSASKVGSEAAITAWQQIQKISGGPTVISLRAGNVIGGGDLAEDRLVPDLIRAVKHEGKVEIRNKNSTRPWQHVLDPLIGYIKAINCAMLGESATSYNFGPIEASLPVREVIEIFKAGIGSETEVLFNDANNDYESKTLDLDPTRAMNELSWKPAWDQREAIKLTFDWWHDYLKSGQNPEKLVLRDIDRILFKNA